jgi:putative ABC transport system permease protein
VSPLNFQDWNAQNHTFASMAGISGASFTRTGPDGTAEQIRGQSVTASFFDVLGVRPIAGRTLVPDDIKPRPDIIIISERLWRGRFGASPSIVGQTILTDGQPRTVIGVMPESFQIIYKADFWWPFYIEQKPWMRRPHFLQVLGRLKSGATIEKARADMAVVAQNIAVLSPGTNKDWGVTIAPIRVALVGPDLKSTTWLLAGVVGFVLLMACANVANLLLTRSAARARELAVRASIGGTRGRIVQQLLTEAIVLAFVGGTAGIGLAALILRAAPSFLPDGMLPVWLRLSLDLRVAGFASALTLLTAVLFGLAPAWQAARIPLAAALRAGGRTSTSGAAFRSILAAGEIAAAVLLVAGAGLLLRTVLSLTSLDPGFRAPNVVTMYVTLPLTRYPTPGRALRFFQNVDREISATPGVTGVGLGFSLPVDGWQIGQGFHIIGDPEPGQGHWPSAHYQMVSAAYFSTLGIPVVRGRPFSGADDTAHEPVCIINEAMAARYFAGRNPLGARLTVQAMDPDGPKPVDRTIVGVSHQVKVQSLSEKDRPLEIYVPITQNPWFAASIAVRSSGNPNAEIAPVKAAIARVDKTMPVTRIRTTDQILAESVAEPRFRAGLVGAFAVLALILAAVGIFGVLAYSVGQRTREFGIRMALGAQSRDVLRLVMREAVVITAAGIAVGLAAAAFVTRTLTTLLFAVDPVDPRTFAATAAVLSSVALVACAVPAIRAVRVDPAIALHHE